jgi:transcriptional regulator with XRE-family HTH domain
VAKLSARQALRNLGHRVIELRLARGLTQEQLAEVVGWLPRQVQRVEAGEANLSLEKLVTLANGFDISLSELLTLPARKAARRPGRPSRGSRG